VAAKDKVYILDQITPKPGRAKDVAKLYMDTYAPGAKSRGMTLEFSLIAPPMYLENQSNVLYFLWSVEGVGGWWASQMQSRVDDAIGDWWRDLELLIESRRRDFPADLADVARLTNV
jgi:hypothetical protein